MLESSHLGFHKKGDQSWFPEQLSDSLLSFSPQRNTCSFPQVDSLNAHQSVCVSVCTSQLLMVSAPKKVWQSSIWMAYRLMDSCTRTITATKSSQHLGQSGCDGKNWPSCASEVPQTCCHDKDPSCTIKMRTNIKRFYIDKWCERAQGTLGIIFLRLSHGNLSSVYNLLCQISLSFSCVTYLTARFK